MTPAPQFDSRFALDYRADVHRRVVGGMEVIIHCHHYNSRVQSVIEGAAEVDGKRIMSESAEVVMREQIANVLRAGDSREDKWKAACALYAHLGFGVINPPTAGADIVTAPHSHYVEGWQSGFRRADRCVCSFTEGFLQAAYAVISGERVYAREEQCAYQGAEHCRFIVDRSRTERLATRNRASVSFTPRARESEARSNVDEDKIVSAIVAMPIRGDDSGLIPAFGVYLANTPADFYNQVCIRFIDEMEQVGQARTARELLLAAGETCAMNTFRGIMHSPEWEALVAPMIEEERDKLFALVSLSNGFGWGNWYIQEHVPEDSLVIQSLNGYEAIGVLERGRCADDGQCLMLAGVSAGMMELVYGEGTIDERFGTYFPEEPACIANGHSACNFSVEAV